jgi:hypothetical protein
MLASNAVVGKPLIQNFFWEGRSGDLAKQHANRLSVHWLHPVVPTGNGSNQATDMFLRQAQRHYTEFFWEGPEWWAAEKIL